MRRSRVLRPRSLFRSKLLPASGFQSAQLRQIEILLGLPEEDRIPLGPAGGEQGYLAALRGAGRTGQVRVVGFDNISAVQDLVRSGEVLATVEQHAGDLAAFGIDYALEKAAAGIRKLPGWKGQIQGATARPPPLDEAQVRRAQHLREPIREPTP